MLKIRVFFLLFLLSFASHVMAMSSMPPAVTYPIDILIDRAMLKDGVARIAGRIDSGESPVIFVLVNDHYADVSEGRFEIALPVLPGSTEVVVYAENESGGKDRLAVALGAPIEIHIDRSVWDGGVARIRGFIDSPDSLVESVTVNQQPAFFDENSFELDLFLEEDEQLVEVVSINTSGGKDTLWINFSPAAPKRGLTLKIQESGLNHLEPLVGDVVDSQRDTIKNAIKDILHDRNFDVGLAIFKMQIRDVTVSDNASVKLAPRATDFGMLVNADILIHQIEVLADVNVQLCWWWLERRCEGVGNIPIDMAGERVRLDTDINVGPGIKEPREDATLLTFDSSITSSIDHVDLRVFSVPMGNLLLDLIVNEAILPVLADGELNKAIDGAVAGLLNVVPTYIPPLMADTDNMISEEVDEGIGLLPLLKGFARGLGIQFNVGETLSTDQQAIVPLDAGFYTGTADNRVRFGYVTRGVPHSNAALVAVSPTEDRPFDGIMVISDAVLNSTLSAFTQGSLIDFTIPMNFENIAAEIPTYLQAKDLKLRVKARDGAPYFSLPENIQDLIALRMNDFIIDFLVDGESLLRINLDMKVGSDLALKDNRLVFSTLRIEERIRSLALNGQPTPEEDAEGVSVLVNLMTNVAARTLLNMVGDLPVPMLPGGRALSFDVWRLSNNTADIGIAFNFVDAQTLAAEDNVNDNTSGLELLASTLMANPVADALDNDSTEPAAGSGDMMGDLFAQLQPIINALNAITSLMTHIGPEPLNALPPENVDRGRPNYNQPEVPAINRQSIALQGGNFTRPKITASRLTRDGRIGFATFTGILTLLKPEMINEPFIAADTPLLLTDSEVQIMTPEVDIDSEEFYWSRSGELQGSSSNGICDPDPQFVPGGKKANPYSCGIDGKDDCYDLHVIRFEVVESDKTLSDLFGVGGGRVLPQVETSKSRLASLPLHVRVENPKTAQARIVEADIIGEEKYSPMLSTQMYEMTVPLDGRLFMTRITGRALTWYNERTDSYVNGTYDGAYAALPESAEPCDVSAITDFKPLSHAPYDKDMKRYKFAAYPFRDPMGQPIADGAEMKGTYPWVSRDGSMMSLTTQAPLLFPRFYLDGDTDLERYPGRCLDPEDIKFVSEESEYEACFDEIRADVNGRALDQGFTFFGLWTQGKMVLADGMINESDFILGRGRGDIEHSLLPLYEPGTGREGNESGDIEVGETRDMSAGPEIKGKGAFGGNGTIMDTTANLLNFWPALNPVTTRDVVWTISSGRQTDELAFDDYLNPDAFIISNMVGAMDSHNHDEIEMTYYDGWNQAVLDFANPVRVQNSATALPYVWKMPEFGEVHFGRLEPTATGGVRGKGLWLDGDDIYLSYSIEKQPQTVRAKPWFINLFIDPRFDDDSGERSLIIFPDGSSLSIIGRSDFIYRDANHELVHSIGLAQPLDDIQWTQLAMQVSVGGKKVKFFLNGYLLDYWVANEPLFQFTQGELILGGKESASGIQAYRGWIDEFKVIAQYTNPEVVCNHAMGTLVGLDEDYEGSLKAQAERYPASAHAMVSKTIKGYGRGTYASYACYHDYSDDYAAHLQNIPAEVSSVRESLLFPEGPLYHDSPRPDSLNNNFCLSCHHKNGQGGLSLNALDRRLGLLAKDDARRQPTQPPQKVDGNLPAYWLPGSKGYDSIAPAEGFSFDELVLGSAAYIEPMVKGFTLVNASNGMDIMPIDNGAVLNLNRLPPKLAIRVAANGVTRNVDYSFDGESGSLSSPYAIYGTEQNGSDNRNFNPSDLVAGNYQLEAVAQDGSAEPLSIAFSVAGVASVAEIIEEDVEEVIEEDIDILQMLIDFFNALYESLFGESESSAGWVGSIRPF